MSLQGAAELRAAMHAIQEVPAWVGSRWADEDVRVLRSTIPARSGRSRGSVRAGDTRGSTTAVLGSRTLDFIDAGSRAHDIIAKDKVLKFEQGGQTFFRKKVHKRSIAARPFKRRAAEEALDRIDVGGELIARWNRAV